MYAFLKRLVWSKIVAPGSFENIFYSGNDNSELNTPYQAVACTPRGPIFHAVFCLDAQ